MSTLNPSSDHGLREFLNDIGESSFQTGNCTGTPDFDEKGILQGCKAGDAHACRVLLERFQRPVFRLARRLCGDDDEARQIRDEAFFRALSNIPSFDGRISLSSWVYGLTVNAYLDAKRVSKDELFARVEALLDTPKSAAAPHENQRLQQALQKLPDYQRVLCCLYYVGRQSPEEISVMLQLPLGTVKSRIKRASLALKSILDEQEAGH